MKTQESIMVLNVAKNKLSNDYLKKEKDRLLDSLVVLVAATADNNNHHHQQQQKIANPAPSTRNALFREFRDDLNKSISKFVQSTSARKRKDNSLTTTSASRTKSICEKVLTNRLHYSATIRSRCASRWTSTRQHSQEKENNHQAFGRKGAALHPEDKLGLRRSMSLLDRRLTTTTKNDQKLVVKRNSREKVLTTKSVKSNNSPPPPPKWFQRQRGVKPTTHEHQQQRSRRAGEWANQLKRALVSSPDQPAENRRGGPSFTATPTNSSGNGNKSATSSNPIANLFRPTHNRLHSLLFVVLINLTLITEPPGRQQPGALVHGAPIPFTLAVDHQDQLAKKAISWLSDGLMTIDPNDPTERADAEENQDQQQQRFTSELSSSASALNGDFNPALDTSNDSEDEATAPWLDLASRRVASLAKQLRVPPLEQDANLETTSPMNEAAAGPDKHEEEEFLWIQRRRLNRDRALEPPAWLRERPIRRDREQQNLVEEEQREDGANNSGQSSAEAAISAEDAQQQLINARPIRGRQLRQSNELYDEILRHLIEEAFGGSNLLANLQGELESRAQQPPNQAATSLDSQSASASASLMTDSTGGPSRDNNKLREQQQAPAVVVVGDEISDNDDVTLLEPMQKQQQQQNNKLKLLDNLQHLRSSERSNQRQLMMLNPAADDDQAAAMLMSTNNDPSASQSGLIEMLRTSLDSIPAQNDQFHVVEDIDQVTDQQQQQQPQQQQSSGTSDDETNSAAFEEDLMTMRRNNYRREPTPAAVSSLLGKRSTTDALLAELSNEETDLTAAAAAATENVDASNDDEQPLQVYSVNGDDEPIEEEAEEEELYLIPVRKSAAFSRESRTPLQPARVASKPIGGQATATLKSANPLKQKQKQAILNGAIRMIQSGQIQRPQLIRMATRLKTTLEQWLGLPRGSIMGLFPVGATQLIIELNENRLSLRDQVNLAQEFNDQYRRGLLTISWPRGSAQNPLPILSAILNALQNDSTQQTEALAGQQAKQQQLQLQAQAVRRQASGGASIEEADDDEQLIAQQQPQLDSDNLDPMSARNWQQVELATLESRLGQSSKQPASAALASYLGGGRGASWMVPLVGDNSGPLGLGGNEFGTANMMLSGEEDDAGSDGEENSDAGDELASSLNGALDQQKLARFLSMMNYLNSLQHLKQQQLQLQSGRLISPIAALSAATLINKSLIGSRKHHQQQLQQQQQQRQLNAVRGGSSWYLIYLAVILLAFLGTYLLVKLFARRRLDKRGPLIRGARNRNNRSLSWRSFWSASSSSSSSSSSAADHQQQPECSTTGTLMGEKQHQTGLGASNYSTNRRASDDSGLETIGTADGDQDENSSKQKGRLQFDLLTQRLLNMLKFYYNSSPSVRSNRDNYDDDEQQPSLKKSKAMNEDDEESTTTTKQVVDSKLVADIESNVEQATRFRSSRSYIKSLIEALTKARSRVFVDDCATTDANEDEDEEDADLETNELDEAGLAKSSSQKQHQKQLRNRRTDDETADEIVVSQMDISAAHLILDYMEKHLEDKERLRREWLELNGQCESSKTGNKQSNSGANNNNKSNSARNNSNNNKANQLVLQRLAKVGLSEQNKLKNRNQSVVPFDRNRVRLGCQQRQQKQAGGASPTNSSSVVQQQQQTAITTTTPSSSRSRRQNKSQATTTNVSGGSSKRQQQQHLSSDYINASFIYDDDPRRPTHIIAQGPNEQTIGQFWQMVWEQEVSVIVMLTRLNENGQRHCHCYWPTNNNAGNTNLPAALNLSAPADQTGSGGTLNTTPTKSPLVAPPPVSPRHATPMGPFELMGGGGGSGTASARRGSVTSVFSSNALIALSQPIVANGDVNDNVLYFDVPRAAASSANSNRNSTDIEEDDHEADEAQEAEDQAPSKQSPIDRHQTSTETAAAAAATTRLEVHLISEHVSSCDYLVRNMYLINRSTGETRTITQFHYLSWPENRTPENVRSLLQFRRKVLKSYRSLSSPILVHCSDGAGRSGTYTLLDIILERIKNGAKEIDPRATLEHLRDQRIGLCATQSQFEFVLVALAEEIQIILNALPK